MLLTHHVDYTKNILGKITADKVIKDQILIGCTANDLCELTNEAQLALNKNSIKGNVISDKKGFFDFLAVYQTHYGILASLHTMSKIHGEKASDTLTEILAWFSFLNKIALNNHINPNAVIGKDTQPISFIFTDSKIEYEQIFDSKNDSQIRHRALGMMLHLIQDSFTVSHCKRNSNNEIEQFYYYKDQDKDKHHKNDDVSNPEKKIKMIEECTNCISSILNNTAYDYIPIFSLSANPQNSDGGIYV